MPFKALPSISSSTIKAYHETSQAGFHYHEAYVHPHCHFSVSFFFSRGSVHLFSFLPQYDKPASSANAVSFLSAVYRYCIRSSGKMTELVGRIREKAIHATMARNEKTMIAY